jgi:hypothetical protein
MQAAGSDAVCASLIFLDLLKGQADRPPSVSWLRPSMFRRSLTREPTWISIGFGLSPFWRPGRRVCWCIAIFGRLPSQRQRSEMTNYTIVGSRSTAMPIAHPKLKRENKTDRSTKPCSNCGRPDRPLRGERAVGPDQPGHRCRPRGGPGSDEPTGSDAGAIIAAARVYHC